MLAPVYHHSQKEIPVLKTIASQKEGINELYKIISSWQFDIESVKKIELLADRALFIIQGKKMKEINRDELKKELSVASVKPGFNIYNFAEKYF
jgi:LAO/AO transport system kinase